MGMSRVCSKFAIPFLILLLSWFLKCSCSHEKSVCITHDGQPDYRLPGLCAETTDINTFCGNIKDNSNTLITVLEGTHTLNVTCEFKEVTNLTFSGTNGSTISCSSNETGFRFLNVSHLEISDIEFTSCGCTGYVVSNLYGLPNETLSALLFIHGSSLTLTNVTVVNAVSASIFIYNVVDYVTMDSCKVINASSNNYKTMSGTVIAYNNHTTTNTELFISQCHFMNSGYTNYSKGYCSNFGELWFSCGLALFHGNPNLTVEISDTILLNNSGCNGGNMAVLLFDFKADNDTSMVTITNTTFTNGSSRYGGGLYMSFENSFSDRKYGHSYNKTLSNALHVTNSTFRDNFAENSGGGVYMQWKQSLILKKIVDMSITDSTFEGNIIGKIGSGGLALNYKTYIDSGNDGHKISNFRVNLDISDCVFHKHIPIYDSEEEEQLLSESSVILARLVPYLGIHNTSITSNNCTAILAVGTTLVFYGSSRISNNTAFMGAGLRLCSDSLMYLTPHMELVITNNSVNQTGGGILVNTNCLVNLPMCFYQFSREITLNSSLLSTIDFSITDNHSPHGENNIFGGSIDYCYFLYVKKSDNSRFINKLQVPNNTVDNPSSISSRPQHVCFYDSNATDYVCGKYRSKSIYPGQNFTISVRVVGQMNGSVSGIVKASVEGASVNESERVQTVNISGESLTYTVYPSPKQYNSDEEATLKLRADVDSDTSTNEYVHHFEPAMITIKYKKCPFGFTINTTTMSCQCLVKDHAVEDCNIENQIIIKTKSAWIGNIDNQTHFVSSKHCPLDYCDPEVSSVRSPSDSLEQDKQCRYNRIGVICGSCPGNWSLVLGSSECRDNCSNVYLLLILPFAVAGFLLVLIIHFLNLTVTMGTVCGLIFYANIVQDYSIELLSEYPIPGLTPILQVFLAWLNLDLGIQTCFYDGMEAFGKTMLLYIFPIYIWLISTLIIYLSNRYIRVTRLMGENAVKVLATLVLLSYSKMLRVALRSLNYNVLNVYIDTTNTTKTRQYRWILDGNIAYFDSHSHIWLFIISLLFIVLTLPFSFSLLCLKFVYSLSNCCRLVSWIDKLKPFFDTYTGPYKDKARFWTGLLLLVRFFLLVIHAFDLNKTVYYYIIISICLILCATMILMNGVYKKHRLNILECFFILNMGLLFLNKVSINYMSGSIISHILVLSAFFVFKGIIVYHICLKLSLRNRLSGMSRSFWRWRNVNHDVRGREVMRGYDQAEDASEDERLFDAASDRLIHFPPLQNASYKNYESSNTLSRHHS